MSGQRFYSRISNECKEGSMSGQRFYSRRRVLLFGTIASSSLLFAACQPQAAEKVVEKPVEKIVEKERVVERIVTATPAVQAAAAPSPAASFKGATVKVFQLVDAATPFGPWVKKQVDQFRSETGANVEYVSKLSGTALITKEIISLRAGEKAFDIGLSHTSENGPLLPFATPLLDFMKTSRWSKKPLADDATPWAQEVMTVTAGAGLSLARDKDVLGIPYGVDLRQFLYRTDLFNDPAEKKAFKDKFGHELEVPRTFQQELNVAKFFTRDLNGDGKIDMFGTAAAFAEEDGTDEWLDRYFANGGQELLTKDLQPTWEDATGIEALRNLTETYKAAMPKEAISWGWGGGMFDLYQSGKLAYLRAWGGWALSAINPKASPKVADKTGVTVQPVGPNWKQGGAYNALHAWVYFIPSNSPIKEAAWSYLDLITSEEPEFEYRQTIHPVPVRQSVAARLEEWWKTNPVSGKPVDTDFWNAQKKGLQTGKAGYHQIPIWRELIFDMGDTISEVARGGTTADAAAKKMGDRARELVKQWQEFGVGGKIKP